MKVRLIENKVISKSDLDLFVIINSVEEAFEHLKQNMDI